jgi:hypothetical protein
LGVSGGFTTSGVLPLLLQLALILADSDLECCLAILSQAELVAATFVS